MTLVACGLQLAARFPQAGSLQLVAIDKNLRAKLLPVVAHDLELQADGLQLGRGGVAYFYCEFFHISSFCVSNL